MYHVEFDPQASDDLASLEQVLAQHILKKLRWLAEKAESVKHRPLQKHLRGAYKLRVGNYRVVYTVNHSQRRIRVHLIGHRDKVYKT